MTNDSSTGGYLAPSPPPAPQPVQGANFDTFLQNVVVGITGLPGNLVFPRWQVVEPNIPGVTINWASIGVNETAADIYPYEAHDPILQPNPIPPIPPAPSPAPANGYDLQITHESISVLASFYGPNARTNAALLRDGLAVAQNREAMQLVGVALTACGRIVAVPALVNSQWYYRCDMPIELRREVVRNYPILDLLHAGITLKSDIGFTDTITV